MARECDWYFLGGMTLEEAQALKADVEERAAQYGRKVRFAISGMIMCRDSEAEARKEIAMLEERAQQDRTARTHVSGLRFGMWGTAEQIADRLAEFSRLGFEMAMLQARSMVDEFRRFGEQVVPLLPVRTNGKVEGAVQGTAHQLIAVS
jgi:alkanesulfonate monooxygenase SsuD/methylene tetrahydromethanopterin reductase-like flavin-dependent oxidoreductase (luciferase family)